MGLFSLAWWLNSPPYRAYLELDSVLVSFIPLPISELPHGMYYPLPYVVSSVESHVFPLVCVYVSR
jgi:hypothetical protein